MERSNRYETTDLQIMAAKPSAEPEVGSRCFVVGNADYKIATVVEIGQARTLRMVRVGFVTEVGTRVFTQRKNGSWIEKGEAAKDGTPLIIHAPQ